MRNDQVYARSGHLGAFLGGADIAGCIQANLSSRRDHFDFAGEAQSNRLKVTANISVEPRYGRIVNDTRKSDLAELLKKAAHISRRIGAAYPGHHRRLLYGWKHMILSKFQHNLVSISVRHQAADGRQAVHPKLAAIVNDDQVDSAKLCTFCGEPVARTPGDYRTDRCDGGAQACLHPFSRV